MGIAFPLEEGNINTSAARSSSLDLQVMMGIAFPLEEGNINTSAARSSSLQMI